MVVEGVGWWQRLLSCGGGGGCGIVVAAAAMIMDVCSMVAVEVTRHSSVNEIMTISGGGGGRRVVMKVMKATWRNQRWRIFDNGSGGGEGC